MQKLDIPQDTSKPNPIVTKCQNIVKNYILDIKSNERDVLPDDLCEFITACAFLRAKKFNIVTSYNEIECKFLNCFFFRTQRLSER